MVQHLRTSGVSRAEDLGARLEVSTRTIYRDIAHLQASGLPIEGAAGVGYLLRPGFDLPSMTFTFDQIEALAVGLSFVEKAGDPALMLAAAEVRAKIQASLPQPEARRLVDAPYFTLRHGPKTPPQVALLRVAIRKRRVVRLTYQDGTGNRSDRNLHPLAIWNLTDGWMFTGWCELRQGFRTFRFDRIAGLALTGDTFEDDAAKGLAAFMALDHCESSTP